MAVPSFDLLDIIRALRRRRNFIIAMVVLGMALGVGFSLVRRSKYKAESSFLVNNPLYTDRNSLFRSMDTRYVDYYGGDDDIDKVIALSSSDTVVDRIIRRSQFHVIYKKDINNPKEYAALMAIFKKNFNLKRVEYRNIEVSYIAYDPQTAANVTNMAVSVLEEAYRSYFTSPKNDVYTSINNKVQELNRSIDSLTDTLGAMRDRYGIYSIVSPTRQNVISGDMKGGGKGFGVAIEQIQNIESIKDQLVSDRAHYISTLNEFSTSVDKSMTYLKVISTATAPQNAYGTGPILAAIIAGFLAFIFSLFYVLLADYMRKLNEVL